MGTGERTVMRWVPRKPTPFGVGSRNIRPRTACRSCRKAVASRRLSENGCCSVLAFGMRMAQRRSIDLTPIASETIDPPRARECQIEMEAVVERTYEMSDNDPAFRGRRILLNC